MSSGCRLFPHNLLLPEACSNLLRSLGEMPPSLRRSSGEQQSTNGRRTRSVLLLLSFSARKCMRGRSPEEANMALQIWGLPFSSLIPVCRVIGAHLLSHMVSHVLILSHPCLTSDRPPSFLCSVCMCVFISVGFTSFKGVNASGVVAS